MLNRPYELFYKRQSGNLDFMCSEYSQWFHECFSKSGIAGGGLPAGQPQGLHKGGRSTVSSQFYCRNIDASFGGSFFLKTNQGILVLLLMYSVLEFMGAISFDSMYSPLILARTGNHELAVGTISAFMASGCLAASIMLAAMKQPKRKLPLMYVGSFMCLSGIALFGMGRNIYQWCAVVFFGCFGAPIYSTCQTVLLREKVSIDMQGRIFSLQGMITGMLSPVGYLTGRCWRIMSVSHSCKKKGRRRHRKIKELDG